jgi:N-acetylglutamate synthase-like GNAT family acetyltransferase
MKLPKGFVFRKATIGDIETIVEFWQKCRIDEGTGKARKREVCTFISNRTPGIYSGRVRQWFVKKDGVVVATGAVDKFERTITDLYVEEECRGRGLGTAILEKLEEQAVRLGVDSLYLQVTLETEPYYLNRGWQRREYCPIEKTKAGDVATLDKKLTPQNK